MAKQKNQLSKNVVMEPDFSITILILINLNEEKIEVDYSRNVETLKSDLGTTDSSG